MDLELQRNLANMQFAHLLAPLLPETLFYGHGFIPYAYY